MGKQSMTFHRVYSIGLLVHAALGFSRMWYWLSAMSQAREFPYVEIYSRGTVLFCVLLILAEMGLCFVTALKLRGMETGGVRLNQVLLWSVIPASAFIQTAIRFDGTAIFVLGIICLLVSLPVSVYYEKRKNIFLAEETA